MGHDESGEGHLQLKIRGGDGEEVVFKVKKATQFSKIFQAYCQRKGIQVNACRYGQRDDIFRSLCALTLLFFPLTCIRYPLIPRTFLENHHRHHRSSIVVIVEAVHYLLLEEEVRRRQS